MPSERLSGKTVSGGNFFCGAVGGTAFKDAFADGTEGGGQGQRGFDLPSDEKADIDIAGEGAAAGAVGLDAVGPAPVFQTDHAQQHGTLFTVAYEPDVIYPNKNDGVDQLREDIEDLRESVSSLEVILIE